MKTCPQCAHACEPREFRKDAKICAFCELDAAYKAVEALEKYINSFCAPGAAYRFTCGGCGCAVFWRNAQAAGSRMYCPSCFDRRQAAIEAVSKKHDLNALLGF